MADVVQLVKAVATPVLQGNAPPIDLLKLLISKARHHWLA
jgi:hypothetical protein